MTRAEQEAVVRSVARTCRGPRHQDALVALNRLARTVQPTLRCADCGASYPFRGSTTPVTCTACGSSALSPFNPAQVALACLKSTRSRLAETDPEAEVSTDQLLTALFDAGNREVAAAVDQAARLPCGQDVNDLICAVDPFPDSAEAHEAARREVPCPKCGTTIAFTPPWFPPEPPTGG